MSSEWSLSNNKLLRNIFYHKNQKGSNLLKMEVKVDTDSIQQTDPIFQIQVFATNLPIFTINNEYKWAAKVHQTRIMILSLFIIFLFTKHGKEDLVITR
jgi:hypothetical protein